MTDELDPAVAGMITPGEEDGRPVFTINRRNAPKPITDIKPCGHLHFAIDEELCEVSCSDCGRRLEPFSVLRRYAEWWGRMQRQMDRLADRKKEALADELRKVAKRRSTAEEDRERIRRAVNWGAYHRVSMEDLQALYDRVTGVVRRSAVEL